jgi:hypothetical protein
MPHLPLVSRRANAVGISLPPNSRARSLLLRVARVKTSSPQAAASMGAPPAEELPPRSQVPTTAATPKQRVQQALGDEVQAGGYAGDLEMKNVSFEGSEVQVTTNTPEGGLGRT